MKNVLSFAINAAIIATTATIVVADTAASQKDRECLALNVYHEARGEDVLGQIAVAQVTMNRVDHPHFPSNVCDVVWQKNQFSWTNDGRSDRASDQKAWDIAQEIANNVYYGMEEDPTEGATFYHGDYIKAPNWTNYMEVSVQIGSHIFYTWDGNWN